jgi:POT family proton-dependent oligopeptide transporter
MPSGIPFIVGNEAAERFSYYGMRTILYPFMTKFLLDSQGNPDVMSPEDANGYQHLFYTAVYFMPLLGSLLADVVIGKYRTIVWLSLVYCLGHAALAIDDTKIGLAVGLTLIAFGAGGIKPCVSAHVGDQFGEQNKHLLPKVYGWFYFSINFGSFYSTLITPAILNRQGHFARWIPEGTSSAKLAFALPGVLMFIATIVFWLGRRRYAHIPPAGKKAVQDSVSGEGMRVMARLAVLYVFVAFFWCLYDQHSTSWVKQGEKLDRNAPELSAVFKYASFGLVNPGDVVSAEQVQSVNPLFIMLFIPIFNYAIFPLLRFVFEPTPLRKVGIGMVLTALSFFYAYWIDLQLEAGRSVSVWHQVGAFAVITAGEVLVSITVLEYSYLQAPPTMKSFIMALYMFSVSLGNLVASAINFMITRTAIGERLQGPTYFLFFAALLMTTTTVYIVVSTRFREKTYIQGEGGGELK